MGIIDTIVLFITLYLVFQIGRWTILPHLKVGVFSFPGADGVIYRSIMYVAIYIATMIFHWIVALLFAIYVVWKIIKTFVPEMILFIPLRSMLLALPPFPPLEAAGILPLYDNLVGILLSGDSFLTKIANFLKALFNFLRSSMGYILSAVGLGGNKTIVIPEIPTPPPTTDQVQTQQDKQDTYLQNKAEGDSKITPSQKQDIHTKYLKCLEENTLPFPQNPSPVELAYYTLQNSQTTIQCQSNSFSAYTDILSLQV